MPDISDNTNWSETDANNNKPSPNGWPEGMMPSGVNDSARMNMGALKRFWDKINPVQTIAPAGSTWQFNTGNAAYPTSYVNGEIYTFLPTIASAGSDQFQVNALGLKPILKRIVGSGSYGALGPQDIAGNRPVQLVYNSALNGGVGAFMLINPFLGLQGDGSGGFSTPGSGVITGNLSVGGTLSVTGTTTFGATTATSLTLTGTGSSVLNVPNGDISTGGTLRGVNMVLSGNGSSCGTLQVVGSGQPLHTVGGGALFDGGITVSSGTSSFATLTASSVSSTSVGAGGLTVTNAATIGTTLTVNGPGTSFSVPNGLSSLLQLAVTGSATIGTTLTVNGTGTPFTVPSGNISVAGGGAFAGGVTGGASSLTSLTLTGGGVAVLNVNNGGITTVGSVTAASLSISGASTLNSLTLSGGGTSVLNVPSGGINVAGGVTAAGLTINGTTNLNGNFTVTNAANLNGGAAIGNNASIHGHLYPSVDATYNCGLNGGLSWSNVSSYFYLTASDAELKTDLAPLPDCLPLVAAIAPSRYRWASGLPDEDVHWGFIAQDVGQVMADAGLAFGGYRVEEGRHSLAYNELLAVLWRATQQLAERVATLEAR